MTRPPLLARHLYVAATLATMIVAHMSKAVMPTLGDCVSPAVSNAPLKRVLDDIPPDKITRGSDDALGSVKIDVGLIESKQQWFNLRSIDASVTLKGPGYRGGGKLQFLQQQQKIRHTITYQLRVDLQFLPEQFAPRLTEKQQEILLAFLKKEGANAFLEAYGEGIVDAVVRGGGVDMVYQFVFTDERSLKRAEAAVSAAVHSLGKGGVNVEEVAQKDDKHAKLQVKIVQRGGLVDPSVIGAVTSSPGQLEDVLKKIAKSLLAIRRNNCPIASYTTRPWKNVEPIIGFDKDLRALIAGMGGLGEARTSAVARLADDYVMAKPRKEMIEKLLRGELTQPRREELKIGLKALTEFENSADDAVAAIFKATTAKQVREVKLPHIPVVQPKKDELVKIGKWARFLYGTGRVGVVNGSAIGAGDFGVYPLIHLLHPELVESITLSHDANVSKAGHERGFGYDLPEGKSITIAPKTFGVGEVGADRIFKQALKHHAAFDSSDHRWGVRALAAVAQVGKMWEDAKAVKLLIQVKGIRDPIIIDITPSKLGWEEEKGGKKKVRNDEKD